MDYSNDNKKPEEFWCSWPIIIFALYVFFPLGIYLIIKKQKLHRRNIFTVGQKTLYASISLFAFGVLCCLPKIISLFVNTPELPPIEGLNYDVNTHVLETTVGIVFIILAIIVFFISIYQKKQGKKYRKYISCIVNKGLCDLDEISNKTSINKVNVIKDLETLIEKRYLNNYELDIEENRIYNIDEEKKRRIEKLKNTRVVECPNCHANNKLEEKVGKCEFCNSYIE